MSIKSLLDKYKGQKGIVPVDPSMTRVTHSVHAMAGYTAKERELIRRYSRKNYGELPAESALGPLPALQSTTK